MSFNDQGIDAFPLCWPAGWSRSKSRMRSKFVTTFARARDQLLHELKLMGVDRSKIIISSDIPLRRDGLPYAGQANPFDPGVAVYFVHGKKPMSFACDQYHNAVDNMHAICKTIEALRGIQRWGASDMMERSFSGFVALPPAPKSTWWEVLQVNKDASQEAIKLAYRRLASQYHPDMGGSMDMMVKINRAYEEATSGSTVGP